MLVNRRQSENAAHEHRGSLLTTPNSQHARTKTWPGPMFPIGFRPTMGEPAAAPVVYNHARPQTADDRRVRALLQGPPIQCDARTTGASDREDFWGGPNMAYGSRHAS